MGSVQHLKNKFGEGYTLTVKLKEMPKHLSTLVMQQFIMNRAIPSASSKQLEDSDNNNGEFSYVQNRLNQAKPSTNKYINLILYELQSKHIESMQIKRATF